MNFFKDIREILTALFSLAGPLKGAKRLVSIILFVVLVGFIVLSQTPAFSALFQDAQLDKTQAFWLIVLALVLVFIVIMAVLTPDIRSPVKELRVMVHVFHPERHTDPVVGVEVRVHKPGPALVPQNTNMAGIAEFRFQSVDKGKEATFCAWYSDQHSEEVSAVLKHDLQIEIPWDFEPTASVPLVVDETAADRLLPKAFDELLKAVIQETTHAIFNPETMVEIFKHSPDNLTEYRLSCIAEWSQPKYQLDQRFVVLTLWIDQGEKTEGARFSEAPEHPRFNDLREVLAHLKDQQAMVLLGEPGSGKSSLLRRLQLDDSGDLLRMKDDHRYSFLVSLNTYRAAPGQALPLPLDWLADRWEEKCPKLPPLKQLLDGGQMLLLLDGLNEMPHASAAEYADRVGLWQQFLTDQIAKHPDNRAVFSCRTLNYSASLSTDPLPVPQVQVQRMTDEQVQQFLAVYLPGQAEEVWKELEGKPKFLDLLRTPYYLKLLTEQVQDGGKMPQGRAGLFTNFVRKILRQQVFERHNPLLRPGPLLDERDRNKLSNDAWTSPYDLPERGLLVPKLNELAFRMQESSPGTDSKQVSISYDEACEKLDSQHGRVILQAGCDLSILDDDIMHDEVKYFHQLLQEYFAARRLVREPVAPLVKVEWQADRVLPSLAETLKTLADNDPLPPLPATGWEETAVLAAAMTEKPSGFIREVMAENLPLAARCLANPEVKPDAALKDDLQQALIARIQDPAADLRARIAAGEVLGWTGDPRFKRCPGPSGDYLLPPLVPIPAGDYPIGDDESPYPDERPGAYREAGCV